jgi:LAO/AO transport system ATPase
MPDLQPLLERLRHRDRLALSHLLSIAARGEHLHGISDAFPQTKRSRVVAVTGSAGVGKSTLVSKLIELARGAGQTVAVLACDPQSPLSGGALLGDRFRMAQQAGDDGVFIRSLAATPGHGALAEHLDDMVRLLEAFGFDLVLIETVGAGQGDTAVRDLADIVVVLLQPGTGDSLQWEKAGLLEVADVLVLHKADLPGADAMAADVRAALELGKEDAPEIVLVSSKTGAGLEALWQILAGLPLRRQMDRGAGF